MKDILGTFCSWSRSGSSRLPTSLCLLWTSQSGGYPRPPRSSPWWTRPTTPAPPPSLSTQSSTISLWTTWIWWRYFPSFYFLPISGFNTRFLAAIYHNRTRGLLRLFINIGNFLTFRHKYLIIVSLTLLWETISKVARSCLYIIVRCSLNFYELWKEILRAL